MGIQRNLILSSLVLVCLQLTICCFALTNRCSAATYVVDCQALNALDTGPGTNAIPFKTINAAAKIAVAGDTVIVRPGLYREDVQITKSGTAKTPITFIASPQGQATITGADIITGWTRAPGDAPIYETPWDHIFAIDYFNGKPIEFHPGNAPVWGRAEQVVCGPDQLTPTSGVDELTADWKRDGAQASLPDPIPPLGPKIVGRFAVDTDSKLLYVCLSDGSDPNSHVMQASTRAEIFGNNQWAFPGGFQYVNVRGFVFKYGATFPQRNAVDLYGKNNTLTDCIVDSMSGAGVAVYGTIEGCIIRNCGQVGGGAQGNNFVE